MLLLIALVAISVPLAFGIPTIVYRVGARIAGSPHPTWRRAVLVSVAYIAVVILGDVLWYFAPSDIVDRFSLSNAVLGLLLLTGSEVVVVAKVFRRVFSVSLWRAIAVCSIALVTSGVVTIGVAISIRASFCEAFIIRNHAMAPAVLGPNRQAICTHCGEAAFVGANHYGICSSCRRTAVYLDGELGRATPADRILANKLRTSPRRWEIVVIKSGNEVRLSRVVALPGEVVWVHEGSVWINQARATLPTKMAGQLYGDSPGPGAPEIRFGSKEDPVTLASDEYFMLGDFSRFALDSRMIGPVRQKQIVATAEVCYWPLGRFGSIEP